MSSARKRGRGIDQKGRSKHGPRFLQLHHWVMDTAAWQALRPVERCLLLELYRLYNGWNNGELFLSVRLAARLLNVSKDTAHKAFRRLQAVGFIRPNRKGIFTHRQATSWVLTEHPRGTHPGTKQFTRWRPPEKQQTVRITGTDGPSNKDSTRTRGIDWAP